MKHCSYCGAEYLDNVHECPIDGQPVVAQSVSRAPQAEKRKSNRYEIPPLPAEDRSKDWVTILSPHSNLEADIVFGRLRATGIRVRFHDSVIGDWLGKDTMRFVQVRLEDYDAARDLLNGS